ncbi:hypothetical protein ACM614_21735, partial [Streptomyces sp. 12297]
FRTLASGRLVLVATYRADDVHRRHPLRPLLAELDRLRTVQRVELSRFTRAEVRRQLTGILSSPPDESLVDTVFNRSDGNAFFVEELIASIESGCRTGLTESLRDLLLVRVEVLPKPPSGWSAWSPRAAPPSNTRCCSPSPGSARTT